uniref:Uncharacterized protein n=1 Tax=Glossina austeni TaxID=7395 RepID=A0A1A9UIF3_GLOAU
MNAAEAEDSDAEDDVTGLRLFDEIVCEFLVELCPGLFVALVLVIFVPLLVVKLSELITTPSLKRVPVKTVLKVFLAKPKNRKRPLQTPHYYNECGHKVAHQKDLPRVVITFITFKG